MVMMVMMGEIATITETAIIIAIAIVTVVALEVIGCR
jgi:hypothetical protein